MLIYIQHSEYRGIELKGKSLFLHPSQGPSGLLLEDVADVVAGVCENLVHIVAFMENKDYAWHFYGRKGLNRDRLELGQVYGGGARLVLDGVGKVHLLYLTRQSARRSALLKHNIFSGSWAAAPLAVSPNVSVQRSDFSAVWHGDGYLHIVYCSYREQHLYYRVFDPKQGIWSGAIPFSQKRCSKPHLISADKLYLFWQEEDGKIAFLVREKEEVWSEPRQISGQDVHTSGAGFALEKGVWTVFWREEAKFYRTIFGQWPGRQEEAPDEYEYVWAVEGGITIPSYRSSRSESISEETPPEAKAAAAAVERKTSEQAEVQAAFVQQAFRVLQEWETMREEIRRWRTEMPGPEPVDLTPVLNRCERLERRFVSLGQTHQQQAEQWRDELEEIRLDAAKVQRRLHHLEQAQKRRRAGFWHRLLERD